MKPILIVVSTYNRRDLTGITLNSIQHNKSSLSDVLIVDDNSSDYDETWLRRWNHQVHRSGTTVGVGWAALRRYSKFLASNYHYICACDNDAIFAKHFDLRLLQLFCMTNDHELTVVSGYRSCTQTIVQDYGDYLFMSTVGGMSHFTDRATANLIVKAMHEKWTHTWDANISKQLSRIVVPSRSLVQHLGIHGTGVNGVSSDTGFDFVGEGQ